MTETTGYAQVVHAPKQRTDAPVTHELKTWPPYFQEVHCGRKNFEVRLNDRDFRAMDILRLREYDPNAPHPDLTGQFGAYTGRECSRMVGYILHGGDPAIVGMEAAHSGIAPGYVVLSLVSTPADNQAKIENWLRTRPQRPPRILVRSVGD